MKRYLPSIPLIIIMGVASIWTLAVGTTEQIVAVLSAFALSFATLPIERWTKTTLPWWVILGYIIILFGSLFLGTALDFYGTWLNWDSFMHAFSGVVAAGFGIIFVEKVCQLYAPKLPAWMRVVIVMALAISMAALWEMGEFISDQLINTDSQLGSLVDSMGDMLWGTLTAIIPVAFFYGFQPKKRSNKEEVK